MCEQIKTLQKPIKVHIFKDAKGDRVNFTERPDEILMAGNILLKGKSGGSYLVPGEAFSKGNGERIVFDGRRVEDAKHVVVKFSQDGFALDSERRDLVNQFLLLASDESIIKIANYIDSGVADGYTMNKFLDAIPGNTFEVQEYIELNEKNYDSLPSWQKSQYAHEEFQFLFQCINRGFIPTNDLQEGVFAEFKNGKKIQSITYADYVLNSHFHTVVPSKRVTALMDRLIDIQKLDFTELSNVRTHFEELRTEFFGSLTHQFATQEFKLSISDYENRIFNKLTMNPSTKAVYDFFSLDTEKSTPSDLTNFLKRNFSDLRDFLIGNIRLFNLDFKKYLISFNERRIKPLIQGLEKEGSHLLKVHKEDIDKVAEIFSFKEEVDLTSYIKIRNLLWNLCPKF